MRIFTAILTSAATLHQASHAASSPHAPPQREYYLDIRAFHNQGMQATGSQQLNRTALQTKLGAKVNYPLGTDWQLRGDVRLVGLLQNINTRNDTRSANDIYLEAKQLYLHSDSVFGKRATLSLAVGRQTFRDLHAWNYDIELDAIRLTFSRTLLEGELAYGGRLFDSRMGDNEYRTRLKNSRFLLGTLQHQWHYKHYIGAYGLTERNRVADDQTGTLFRADELIEPRTRLSWYGINSHGEYATATGSIHYSGTLATLYGDTQALNITTLGNGDRQVASFANQSIKGAMAVDLKLIWRPANQAYAIGLNYAAASGSGNISPGEQKRYVQPSIATNKNDVLGTSRYRYYGEALNPDLSNLHIATLSAGRPINESIWLEAAYHLYRQDKASPLLEASSPKLSPNGNSRDIGQGLDLVLGGTLKDGDKLQFILSGFWGGNAYSTVQVKTIYRALVNYRVLF